MKTRHCYARSPEGSRTLRCRCGTRLLSSQWPCTEAYQTKFVARSGVPPPLPFFIFEYRCSFPNHVYFRMHKCKQKNMACMFLWQQCENQRKAIAHHIKLPKMTLPCRCIAYLTLCCTLKVEHLSRRMRNMEGCFLVFGHGTNFKMDGVYEAMPMIQKSNEIDDNDRWELSTSSSVF